MDYLIHLKLVLIFFSFKSIILNKFIFFYRTAVNRAYNVYPIKGQSKSCGQTRLLLFHCAQQVFKRALRLSGINPLDRI